MVCRFLQKEKCDGFQWFSAVDRASKVNGKNHVVGKKMATVPLKAGHRLRSRRDQILKTAQATGDIVARRWTALNAPRRPHSLGMVSGGAKSARSRH
ncbi:MAG: hypothetical protein U5K75_02290 [Ahrensia sp.]|nr:hypothetical protein [Ahrensia sp.]